MLVTALLAISVVCFWYGGKGIYKQWRAWRVYKKNGGWSPCGRPDSRI